MLQIGQNEFGHQGLLHEEELDNGNRIQNRHRVLHAGLGRFIQRDPLGYVDGMSLYQYVRGNPVVLLDVFGTATVAPMPLLGYDFGGLRGGGGGWGGGLIIGGGIVATGVIGGELILNSGGRTQSESTTKPPQQSGGDDSKGNIENKPQQPASEQTAKDMAKQLERDLGKEARRRFHDEKEGNDRTLEELKRDAQDLYDEYGKRPPSWMKNRGNGMKPYCE